MEGYWTSVLRERISRRRALVATAAGMTGAALLTACGGGKDDTGGDKSSLVSPVDDTSKQAKRGGIVKYYAETEPSHFDVHLQHNPQSRFNQVAANKLFIQKPGYLKPTDFKEVEGDMIESWERSPDQTQITMKLRPNLKWHNKAPVNGRPLDIADVLFSWERYTKVGAVRSAYANSVNPDAPILSFTSVDPRTFVVKLARPVSYILNQFAAETSGQFQVVPKETDSTYDIRKDIIGTGPLVLEKYEPSIGVTLKRNPEFFKSGLPFIDGAEVPFVIEYATGVAQLKAGNVYAYDVRPDDVIAIKREVSALKMYKRDVQPRFEGIGVVFGWQGKPAWLDERVRQALSMSWDRDLWLETFGNIAKFEADGLPMDTIWNSHIGYSGGYWDLDPRDAKTFGPNAKYFQHDLAESKKLLAAAGFPNGVDVPVSRFRAVDEKWSEVFDGMASEAGFRVIKREAMELSRVYPMYRDGNGQWDDGWVVPSGGPLANDPVAFFTWRYTKAGGPGFLGFDTNGKGDQSGDATVDALVSKANLEPDLEKRRAYIHDLQRHLAKAQYTVIKPGAFSDFRLAWPALRNFGIYQVAGRGEMADWWIDPTLAPITKS